MQNQVCSFVVWYCQKKINKTFYEKRTHRHTHSASGQYIQSKSTPNVQMYEPETLPGAAPSFLHNSPIKINWGKKPPLALMWARSVYTFQTIASTLPSNGGDRDLRSFLLVLDFKVDFRRAVRGTEPPQIVSMTFKWKKNKTRWEMCWCLRTILFQQMCPWINVGFCFICILVFLHASSLERFSLLNEFCCFRL